MVFTASVKDSIYWAIASIFLIMPQMIAEIIMGNLYYLLKWRYKILQLRVLRIFFA